MRWCTKNMKIKPIEEWIGDEPARSPTWRSEPTSPTARATSPPSPTSRPEFPFVEDGIDHDGVMRILSDAGIGLPAYYEWRTRSGCYFCFYQRKAEWIGLSERPSRPLRPGGGHRTEGTPGRWRQRRRRLRRPRPCAAASTHGPAARPSSNSDPAVTQILERHDASMARANKSRANLPLIEALADAFDEEDDTEACTVCAL